MARGVNKVILVGTLGKDPEVRYSQAGAAMTSISVATNESWKDKVTGEKMERTEWHRVKFFGRLAEIAGEYLQKGGQVYIEGALRTEKYTDKQAVEKYSTDIIANEMQMLGSPSSRNNDERSQARDRGRSTGNTRGGRDDDSRSSSRPTPRRESRDRDEEGYGGRTNYSREPSRVAEPSRHDEPFPDDDIPF